MNVLRETEAVVVGAGPAGLAAAACLKRAKVELELLEQGDQVGASWRGHYDRLHLHTPRSVSGLPFFRMPTSFPRYPSRDQVLAYLSAYAAHFELQPRLSERVIRVAPEGVRWLVETDHATYASHAVVVATGLTRVPHEPSWPGFDSFPGTIVHSARYKNGAPYRGQRVLVVGFGNSACEIAICLHEHGAQPAIAVREAVNVIPRDVFGLPILAVGILLTPLPPRLADALSWPIIRFALGDIEIDTPLRRHREGTFERMATAQKLPVLNIGTIELIREGALEVFPGIARFEGSEVVFEDQRRARFDAVILGTGYRAAVDAFVQADGALDDHGTPRVSGGPSGLPGLYFCGYHLGPSGLLHDLGPEARRIAKDVRRSLDAAP